MLHVKPKSTKNRYQAEISLEILTHVTLAAPVKCSSQSQIEQRCCSVFRCLYCYVTTCHNCLDWTHSVRCTWLLSQLHISWAELICAVENILFRHPLTFCVLEPPMSPMPQAGPDVQSYSLLCSVLDCATIIYASHSSRFYVVSSFILSVLSVPLWCTIALPGYNHLCHDQRKVWLWHTL